MTQRYGIIDIGSNSIRLVIYEKTDNGAHRVVDGNKRSARLSSKINEQGELNDAGINDLIETLQIFTLLSSQHKLVSLVPIATAAIRNATNQQAIIARIYEATGLQIRILTGEEEAKYGFLGMANSLNIQNGFLLDVGGGSSELTLFLNRKIVHSFSFSFGCVSFNKKYDSQQGLSDQQLQSMQQDVITELNKHHWISQYAELPLIAVGGTARSLCKIHQAAAHYPFTKTHNYPIPTEQVEELFQHLRQLPQDKRKKEAGLSKDRADVIVPGIAVLSTIFQYIQGSHYIICGAGLRDGLFHKLFFPEQPLLQHPLQYSVQNLIALHTAVPRAHVELVSTLAGQLLQQLHSDTSTLEQLSLYLDAAAKLYRIGATIDYYDYSKHTFYLIIHSHLNGLSHKEILLIAAIASYRSKNKTRNELKDYSELIDNEDLDLIGKLGMLLQLAAALDHSETQSFDRIVLEITEHKMMIQANTDTSELSIEQLKVKDLVNDFKKQWNVEPELIVAPL